MRSEFYDFSLNTFFNILNNSDFKFSSLSLEEKLSLAIFGEFEEVNHNRKNIIRYNLKNELDKDIERVKFAKTLRKVYEQKIIINF